MWIEKAVLVAAYLVSVFISDKYCSGYWVVGPVFAAAFLLSRYKKVLAHFSWRHIAFAAASTLVYALVWWIADNGWKFQNDTLDMIFGSLSAAVIVGSILMPSIHVLLFGGDLKKTRQTAVLLVLSWYAVVLVSHLGDINDFGRNIDYGLVSIALWQGIYFLRLTA